VPFTSFSEVQQERGGDVWFAFDESRPPRGLRRDLANWTSVRKVRRVLTTNDRLWLFGTTAPNDVVGPVHPKAMPVMASHSGAQCRCETQGMIFRKTKVIRSPFIQEDARRTEPRTSNPESHLSGLPLCRGCGLFFGLLHNGFLSESGFKLLSRSLIRVMTSAKPGTLTYRNARLALTSAGKLAADSQEDQGRRIARIIARRGHFQGWASA